VIGRQTASFNKFMVKQAAKSKKLIIEIPGDRATTKFGNVIVLPGDPEEQLDELESWLADILYT
jgi:hypothetical protein